MPNIKMSGFVKESVVDGPGFRFVLFTQGCPRHCPGCHNPELIPIKGGREVTTDEIIQLIKNNISPLTRGITISGGDPLMQDVALEALLIKVRDAFPIFDVWLYTGYYFEEVRDLPALGYVDVLVDGPYLEELKDIGLAFRGSTNQRLIDVSLSLKTGQTVLFKL